MSTVEIVILEFVVTKTRDVQILYAEILFVMILVTLVATSYVSKSRQFILLSHFNHSECQLSYNYHHLLILYDSRMEFAITITTTDDDDDDDDCY